MGNTIVEPCEVVRYASISPEYPTRLLCDIIEHVEEEFANTCIGYEFYQYLLSDLVDKSGYVVGKQGVKYQENEIIQYECEYYKAKQNDVTLNDIKNDLSFEKLSKFVDKDNQILYEKYLRRIIALKVYAQSLTESTIKSSSGGVIVNIGDSMGNRTANRQELAALKDATLSSAAQAIDNMYNFVYRMQKDNRYKKFGNCGISCDTPSQNVKFRKRFLV